GRWRRAEAILTQAAQLTPGSVDAWALLALARAHRGHHKAANEAMQRAFERFGQLDEQSTNALIETNNLHAQLIQEVGDLAQAKNKYLWRVIKFLMLAYRLGDRRFVSLGSMSWELARMLRDQAELAARLAAISATIERAKQSLS